MKLIGLEDARMKVTASCNVTKKVAPTQIASSNQIKKALVFIYVPAESLFIILISTEVSRKNTHLVVIQSIRTNSKISKTVQKV